MGLISIAVIIALVFTHQAIGRDVGRTRMCDDCNSNINYLIKTGQYDINICRPCGNNGPCILEPGEFHHKFLSGETPLDLIPQLRDIYIWWCDNCIYEYAEFIFMPVYYPEHPSQIYGYIHIEQLDQFISQMGAYYSE